MDHAIISFLLITLAFSIALLWAPLLTNYLYKKKFGKQIRTAEEAPIVASLHAKKAGTPTMGGVLIWGTVGILALSFFLLSELFPGSIFTKINFLTRPQTFLPFGILITAALVGLLDDVLNIKKIGAGSGGLRMRQKLLMYAIIAAIGAWWFYVKLDWSTIHLPFIGNFDIGLWYVPIFFVVIIATAFSVNESDGLDGLAGGTLLTSFAALGAVAFLQSKYDLASFCLVILGATLAFLWFNIPPARFFMGDTGSMSLGITLGVVAMLTNSTFLLPIIGFVFVLESLSVIVQIISKKFLKKKMFISTPLHHHFEAIGWPEPKIVMRFWILAGVSATIGFILAVIDFTY